MTQNALKKMYQLLLTEPHAPTVCAQLERIAREALADHAMRQVQRLGQEIEQEPVAVYGYCPQCGAKGVMRERRPNGNDKCANGHTYPSSTSTPPQRTWVGLTKNERLELYRQFENCFESDDCEYEKAIEAKLKKKNT